MLVIITVIQVMFKELNKFILLSIKLRIQELFTKLLILEDNLLTNLTKRFIRITQRLSLKFQEYLIEQSDIKIIVKYSHKDNIMNNLSKSNIPNKIPRMIQLKISHNRMVIMSLNSLLMNKEEKLKLEDIDLDINLFI